MENKWSTRHTNLVILCIILGGLSYVVFLLKWSILIAWLITFISLLVLLLTFSHGISGLGRFWLINEQNRMSLSRLQMYLWMLVISSAYLTAFLANIYIGKRPMDAVSIAIPEELWYAMGLSAATLVGTGLILTPKKDKIEKDPEDVDRLVLSSGQITPDDYAIAKRSDPYIEETFDVSEQDSKKRERDESLTELESKTEKVRKNNLNGVLVKNAKPLDANLGDLVTGEEIGNGFTLVPTRFAELVFTLILVGGYAVSLGSLLMLAGLDISACYPAVPGPGRYCGITAFPELGTSGAALLTLVSSAYLADKYPDKQSSQRKPVPDPEQ